MEEEEFRRLLDLFPIVRSRNYRADSESTRVSTSQSATDELTEWQDAWDEFDKKETEIHGRNNQDPFWEKLRLAAERKMGAAEAGRFCEAFQNVYKQLVHKELTSDTAQRLINSVKS